MNDTPGWASPGSAPSDGQEPDVPGPAEPADQSGQSGQTDQSGQSGQSGQPSKWSEQQPPAGQWSAPGAPGTGPTPQQPAPGWGGQYQGAHTGRGAQSGWGGPYQGGGWGGPPPAAKPGVIPLRPLGVGEILDGAVSTMRAHWRTVLGISLGVALITQLAVVLVQGFALEELNAAGTTSSDAGEAFSELGNSAASDVIAQLIALFGTVLATAMLTMVISRAVLGRSVTIGEAWRESRSRLPRLVGLTLLLIVMIVAIFTVGVLPGILTRSWELGVPGFLIAVPVAVWLWIRYVLASPALMLEKQGVLASMRRSAKLVRGSWWRTFGIWLLANILTGIVNAIIVVPFFLLGLVLGGGGMDSFVNGTTEFTWAFLIISGIGSVVALTITFPISAGVTALLYMDQRIRREALDLELARAAGLQGYADTPPPGTAAGS
ncbi:glycerophosphoryl diester phosphodiesterase membrane domain-containing protein [Streptomyces sp. A3M-1-3]|uniref:glycerophosphoryl diester phosphodiesterase membrane domain-containing protein n=1 Tax=Streptomyces sp. A3M-1-3 TaxID=2962044 RepID=UPI0020B8BDD4|nr:glycerophosphoryl diester phosphodiesterase membrane domain-containing protein [Streptomyces sp. A3M-1-3]MCP3822143.1 glycerophosphoryl diester phosphodiesterase membrane domain-containing protein [Streptomyces sp. A3M-1-3]